MSNLEFKQNVLGSMPAMLDTDMVFVRFAYDIENNCCKEGRGPYPKIYADAMYWDKKGNTGDIIEYRIVPEVKADPVKVDPNHKDTNPKDAVGIRKAPMSVIPTPVLAEVGLGMLEGASKYGRHNWRGAGIRTSVYYDATMRHLISFWEGEDIDPDSGLSHVTKAICSLMVLRDAMIQGMCTDDRPPRSKPFYAELNKLAGEILDRHADKKPKHWTVEDDVK